MAKTSFPIETYLATDIIVVTAFTNDNIEKISSKKDTLKAAGSSLFAVDESVGNNAYMADSLELKQRPMEKEYRKHY